MRFNKKGLFLKWPLFILFLFTLLFIYSCHSGIDVSLVQLDKGFGNDGIVTYAGSGGDDKAKSIALDSSGNIYAAGFSENFDYDMIIWKYDSTGNPVSGFGTGGIVTHDMGHGADSANSIVLDHSGNIYAAGISKNGNDYDMVIWKYDSTGNLVSDFGTGGIVTYAGGNGWDGAFSIALDGSGNIYAAGYHYNGSNYDMAIWKYDSVGKPFSGFGTNGFISHHNASGGNGNDVAMSMVLDGFGNIYAAGYSDNGSDDDMVIWKYDSTGNPVSGFGTGGIVTYVGGGVYGGDYSIALDGSGNIYVAGSSYNDSDSDMAIWKYDRFGNLVSDFGTNGVILHHNAAGGDGFDEAYSIALDGSSIYAAGYSYNSSNADMAIWKYK